MSDARRAASAGWLTLVGSLWARGTSAVVFLAMARVLGVAEVGRFSFAVAYTTLFQVVAELGLQQIVIREVARADAGAAAVVGNAVLLRLGLAVVVDVAALGGAIAVGLDPTSVLLVAIGCAWTLGNALAPLGAVFRARLDVRVPTVANAVGNVVYLVAGLWAVLALRSEAAVLAALVASSVGALAWIAWLGRARLAPRWRPSRAVAAPLLAASAPLALNAALMVIYGRIDQVMLAALDGPAAVGTYAAAVKLVELWNVVPFAVMSAVFPLLARHARAGGAATDGSHRRVLARTTELLTLVILGVVPPVWRHAGWILETVFGPGYEVGARALEVLVAAELFLYYLFIYRDALVSEGRERLTLLFGAVTTAGNVALNAWLIPRMGIDGAAWATLLALASVVVLAAALPETRAYVAITLRAAVRPLLAAAASGLVLAVTSGPLSVVLGAATYLAGLLATGALGRRDLDLVLRSVRRSPR